MNYANKQSDELDIFYLEGLNFLDKYLDNNFSQHHLEKALNNFIFSVESNKNRAEPYAYISYCMYLIGEYESSSKYLEIASIIDENSFIVKKMNAIIVNYYKKNERNYKKPLTKGLYDKINTTYNSFMYNYNLKSKVSNNFIIQFS